MSFLLSIATPFFFMICRLLMGLGRWVLLKMPWNRKWVLRSGINSSKVSECHTCDGWRKKLLLLWILSGVLGSIWFSCCLEDYGLSSARVFGEQFNISKKQLPTLASLLSKLDQECKSIFQIEEPSTCEGEFYKRLIKIILKISGWILVGMMVVLDAFCLPRRLWKYTKRQEVHQPHQIQSCKAGGRWGKRILLLGVAIGVFISGWIFWSMSSNVVYRRTETLASMCDERARMLQDQFNVSMNHVHALAIMISTFHHGKQPSAIDQFSGVCQSPKLLRLMEYHVPMGNALSFAQKTFAEYTARTAFERPLTSGVAYALKVLHAQREEFEKQYGWVIKKMETEDHSPVQKEKMPENLDPSPVQTEYAPVILSQETVSHILSVDMMSGKEDRENILRARASGKGVLTSPFKLLKSNHLGVVLTFALYKTDLPSNANPEERVESTVGYLGASFDVETLVEKLLEQLASKETIVVNVYDTTDISAPIKMYGPDAEDTDLLHISNLDFGDPFRKHEMHCRFNQKAPLPWSAITTSLGVLVIVLLLGHIFHAAISRIEKVEDDYNEMRALKVRAEAADVAKSQFLATVSHEIRTPMNGVLGMLQMLMDTDLDETQQDFAMTAQASGKALIQLINEVLDQAKIESGRLELESVVFDVHAVLDNVISLFSDKSQAKGIELAVFISDRVPAYITGDPGRFRQIITNLVGNSIKFTEEGHIFVSVHLVDEVTSSPCDQVEKKNDESCKKEKEIYNTLSGFRVVDRQKIWESFKMFGVSKESADSINLLVTVEDTGVGIPNDAQTRIFMPFMQADSSTSRTYGGTGIGLSISKCLVDLMGGEIGFASEAGIGSTFAFTAVVREGQRNSVDMKKHQSDIIVSDFKGMRGLVVDGRSIHAEVTKYHLKRLDVHVEVAIKPKSLVSCVSEACRSSATGHLDMVLVDKESWAAETGHSFSHLLTEIWQNTGIESLQDPPKVFLLATSLSFLELEEIKSAGRLDNVILKPLRLSKIVACLRKALGVGNKRHQDREQSFALRNLLCGKQILVVDDNVVNRRVAAGALKKYGALVTCAESGKIAVGMLRPPHKFDACFMDVQMPEMDGFEATRQIRALERNFNEKSELEESSRELNFKWHVPILAMTADVFQATHDECLRCGMDSYVSKPFEEEQLYSSVAHFFECDTGEQHAATS